MLDGWKGARRLGVRLDVGRVRSKSLETRNEKMIIKGRSPTMRHESRTHKVALDWLFDRINLDSKIQIKYVDTKNQLADMLTKGGFTRNEWNHLLRLLCIMNFSMFSCSHFFFQSESRVPCQREGKKVLPEKVRR